MAFTFPADKADFAAPNGVTYSWDIADEKWRVKAFMSGGSSVTVSQIPPDNPSDGDLWFDSSPDVVALFVWVENSWVSASPSATAALESRIAANEQSIRDLWSDQTRQDFEVAGLDNRIDALEGVVGEFQYIIQTDNATPRDGQLAFLKGDMSTTTRWNEATNIAVNPNSLSGAVWDTSEIVTGDVLRFHLKGDITMEVSAFEAKIIQNNNNLFSIDQVLKEVGTIMDGAEYEVFHLSSFDPSGLATMVYVDAQDQNLKDYTDGQIADLQSQIDGVDGEYLTKTGSQELDKSTWRLRQPGSNDVLRSFITISGGDMNLYHVADPTAGDDAWAATKGYADKHLKLTGGDLTGNLNLSDSARIYGRDADGNRKLTIFPSGLIESSNGFRSDRTGDTQNCYEAKKNGTVNFSVQASGKASTKYNVRSSDSDETLVTKKYVDEAVTSAGALGPARLAWKYSSVTNSDQDPGDGYFRIHMSGGSTYYRFSFKTSNGVDFGHLALADSGSKGIGNAAPIGTIWLYYPDTNQWRFKQQFVIEAWRWNYNNHIEFKRSGKFGVSDIDFTSNTLYHITVAGFF